jgi:hypothetical protein
MQHCLTTKRFHQGKASTNGGDVRNGHPRRWLRRNREGALLNILNRRQEEWFSSLMCGYTTERCRQKDS